MCMRSCTHASVCCVLMQFLFGFNKGLMWFFFDIGYVARKYFSAISQKGTWGRRERCTASFFVKESVVCASLFHELFSYFLARGEQCLINGVIVLLFAGQGGVEIRDRVSR